MFRYSLGGYEISNTKLIYENGEGILYKNGTYICGKKSNYLINAKCSVYFKPNKHNDSVTLSVIVNGRPVDSKEVKVGSTAFDKYSSDITSVIPLCYGDKLELYCDIPCKGYLDSDSSKNTLTIIPV